MFSQLSHFDLHFNQQAGFFARKTQKDFEKEFEDQLIQSQKMITTWTGLRQSVPTFDSHVRYESNDPSDDEEDEPMVDIRTKPTSRAMVLSNYDDFVDVPLT